MVRIDSDNNAIVFTGIVEFVACDRAGLRTDQSPALSRSKWTSNAEHTFCKSSVCKYALQHHRFCALCSSSNFSFFPTSTIVFFASQVGIILNINACRP